MRTLTLSILILLPVPAFGWGEDGHRAVARIAEQHLTEAKAAVRDLLGDRYHRHDVRSGPT